MKLLENLFKNNKNNKLNKRNYDLIYIVTILFLLIISILIYMCFFKNSKNKPFKLGEGFDNNIKDILVGRNRTGLDENVKMGDCVFSTYKTQYVEYNQQKILSFWNPILDNLSDDSINDYFIGNILDLHNQSNMSILDDLNWNELMKSIKLNLELMNETQKNKITLSNETISNLLSNQIKNIKLTDYNTKLNFKYINYGLNLNPRYKIIKKEKSDEEIYNIKNILDFFNNKGSVSSISQKDYYGISNYEEIESSNSYFIKKINRFQNVSLEELINNIEEELKTINEINGNGRKEVNKYYLLDFFKENFVDLEDSTIDIDDIDDEKTYTKQQIDSFRKTHTLLFPGQFYKNTSSNKMIDKFSKTVSGFIKKTIYYNLKNNKYIRTPVFIKKNTPYNLPLPLQLKQEIDIIHIIEDQLDITKQLDITDIETKIINEFNNYKSRLESFKEYLSSENLLLTMPFRFIQINDNDKESICFGDIIDLSEGNDSLKYVLKRYSKIPRRCCYNTNQTYDDLEPIYTFKNLIKEGPEFTEEFNKIYDIYKHPFYNTFKIFERDNEIDNNLKRTTYIYKIHPCPNEINKYKTITNNYKTLKSKCLTIKKNNSDVQIKDNLLDNMLIDSKEKQLVNNSNKINKLKKNLIKLKNEIKLKNSIRRTSNRQKLQSYNNKTTEYLNLGYDRLLNDRNTIDFNVEFNKDPKQKLLILADMFKESLDNSIMDEIKNEIRSKEIEEAEEELQEILEGCPDLENFIKRDEIPCHLCNL